MEIVLRGAAQMVVDATGGAASDVPDDVRILPLIKVADDRSNTNRHASMPMEL